MAAKVNVLRRRALESLANLAHPYIFQAHDVTRHTLGQYFSDVFTRDHRRSADLVALVNFASNLLSRHFVRISDLHRHSRNAPNRNWIYSVFSGFTARDYTPFLLVLHEP